MTPRSGFEKPLPEASFPPEGASLLTQISRNMGTQVGLAFQVAIRLVTYVFPEVPDAGSW